MGLQSAYQNAMKNWDAKKDSVNKTDDIPAGEYQVILDRVEHPTFKSGWDCLQFTMQVIKGEFAGRKEYIRLSLATTTKAGKPMPDFVVNRAIRTIDKVAAEVGLHLTPNEFPDNETDAYERLVTAFKPYEAKPLAMKITVSENKKDPDNPYRNYDFGPGEQIKKPIAETNKEIAKAVEGTMGDTTTVDDEELPF